MYFATKIWKKQSAALDFLAFLLLIEVDCFCAALDLRRPCRRIPPLVSVQRLLYRIIVRGWIVRSCHPFALRGAVISVTWWGPVI